MERKLQRAGSAMPNIKPISKTNISDSIVEQIIGLIERGDLKPGQRLPPERELCLRFGTGRSSLREALRCLSIVGVLHARVGEGTSVAANSGRFLGKILHWRLITEQRDIESLMEVRIALEGLSAASVARNASTEDLQALDTLLSKMTSAQNSQTRFTALDLEFHLALARASGNQLLLDLITTIRGQLAKVLNRMLASPNAGPLSLQEHKQIVQSIKRGDPEAARNAMDVHLRAALERYRKTATKIAAPAKGIKGSSKSTPALILPKRKTSARQAGRV